MKYNSSKFTDKYNIPPVLVDFCVNNHYDAMAIVYNDIIVNANHVLASLLGTTLDDLIGTSVFSMMTPESAQYAKENLQKRIDGIYVPGSRKYDAIKKDGKLISLDIAGILWPDDHSILVAIVRDITRQEAEIDALREAQSVFKLVMDSLPIAVSLMDKDGNYFYINDEFTLITGYSKDDVYNGEIYLSDSDDQFMKNEIEKAVHEQGFAHNHEKKIVRKDGEHRWISASWQTLFDDKGKFRGVELVFYDITDKKLAKQAFQESESILRQVLDLVPHHIHAKDSNGTFLMANKSVADSFGMTTDEIIGKTHFDSAVNKEEAVQMLKDDMEVINSGKTKIIPEECYTDIDGVLHWLSTTKTPFVIKDIPAVLNCAVDITDRKLVEDKLIELHKDLEKSYNLQREFLNNITHEVRTPLTAVQGYVKMLLEGIAGPLEKSQITLLEKVLESSDNLLDIVSSVLEFTRLKSGRSILNPKACNPYQLVDKALNSILPQIKKKKLMLNVHKISEGSLGMYDEQKVLIIITNLLSNAVKFTQYGQIDVFVECDSKGMEIIIADTGQGIYEHDIPNIFDEFHQLDYPRKYKPTGFGLGLSIVASMIEITGSSLTVSSDKEFGTVFTLKVPVVES